MAHITKDTSCVTDRKGEKSSRCDSCIYHKLFSSTGNAKDDRNLLKPNSKLKIPLLIYNSSLDFLDFFFFPAEGNLNVLVASRWRYSTNESTSLAPEYFSGLSLLFMGAK